jgi:hypothetical protein
MTEASVGEIEKIGMIAEYGTMIPCMLYYQLYRQGCVDWYHLFRFTYQLFF